ncbi:MAG TPA: hypothetical protein VNB03_11755 [Casimicrobiaceae bacterium]|nr:hypothetical protein [Casimicrobiaceae bacterium]
MRNACEQVVVLAGALALAACATTTMRDSWFDPSVRSAPFARVLVVTVGGDLAQQRIFEDMLAEKLRTVGIDAVQGYRFLPDSKATEAQMDAAVARAGADGLMLVRFKGVRTETEVRTSMVPGAFGPGWYGWYGSWYAVPEVYQTRIATVETSLFDVGSRKLAWTGVTETYDPASFRKDAGRLADIIVGALATHRLTPKGAA